MFNDNKHNRFCSEFLFEGHWRGEPNYSWLQKIQLDFLVFQSRFTYYPRGFFSSNSCWMMENMRILINTRAQLDAIIDIHKFWKKLTMILWQGEVWYTDVGLLLSTVSYYWWNDVKSRRKTDLKSTFLGPKLIINYGGTFFLVNLQCWAPPGDGILQNILEELQVSSTEGTYKPFNGVLWCTELFTQCKFSLHLTPAAPPSLFHKSIMSPPFIFFSWDSVQALLSILFISSSPSAYIFFSMFIRGSLESPVSSPPMFLLFWVE